jgi:hypothetical protein
VGSLQVFHDLFFQDGQIPDDLRDVVRRDRSCRVVTGGVPLLRMRFDFAHPFLTRGVVLDGQGVGQALDHSLVVTLASTDSKAAGAQGDVRESEDSVAGRLESEVVGDSPTFRSARERSTMLKRSAISFGLVGSALYHPSCESFSKVIFVADQEDFARVLQGSQEMIACAVSLLQVFQRINGRVDGAPQLLF